MAKATWNGTLLAQSDATVVIEGNHYFPPDSLKKDLFTASAHTTVCSWKGTASYYSLEVNGERNENAAWYYAEPKEAANEIKDYVAFWKGVEVEA